MTNPVLDFDPEKRRRWYAFAMAFVGASTIMTVMLTYFLSMSGNPSGAPLWSSVLALFSFWFFFFVFEYAAAYAVWYRPHASRRRAICLSLFAIFVVYVALIGVVSLFSITVGLVDVFKIFFLMFWETHKGTFCAPYFTAAIVGWFFTRPAPDVRDSF